MVFEGDDPEIPKSVRQRAPSRSDPTNVLVRFYEKNHNNNWYAPIRNRLVLVSLIFPSTSTGLGSSFGTSAILARMMVSIDSFERSLHLLNGRLAALDAQMLAPSSKYQRWRNNNRRTECRNAYQSVNSHPYCWSCALMLLS